MGVRAFFEFLLLHEVCFVLVTYVPLDFTVFSVCVCVLFISQSGNSRFLSGILSLMICCSGKFGFQGKFSWEAFRFPRVVNFVGVLQKSL